MPNRHTTKFKPRFIICRYRWVLLELCDGAWISHEAYGVAQWRVKSRSVFVESPTKAQFQISQPGDLWVLEQRCAVLLTHVVIKRSRFLLRGLLTAIQTGVCFCLYMEWNDECLMSVAVGGVSGLAGRLTRRRCPTSVAPRRCFESTSYLGRLN